MVKIHFLQKVLKKWSSFRKKNKIFFSITGGGGRAPIWNFPYFFFFEPFPNVIFKFHRSTASYGETKSQDKRSFSPFTNPWYQQTCSLKIL